VSAAGVSLTLSLSEQIGHVLWSLALDGGGSKFYEIVSLLHFTHPVLRFFDQRHKEKSEGGTHVAASMVS